jgi:hypothetical protein
LLVAVHVDWIPSQRRAERNVDVEAIDVGAVGLDAFMLAAAPLILAWLRELDDSVP